MLDFASLAIGGIALIPLVIGLVQVIRNLGVSGNPLTFYALGIGAIAGLLFKISQMFPIAQPWVELVIFTVGFALFALAATGLYDLGKVWVEKIQPLKTVTLKGDDINSK